MAESLQLVPILGVIMYWGNGVLPGGLRENWELCDGTEIKSGPYTGKKKPYFGGIEGTPTCYPAGSAVANVQLVDGEYRKTRGGQSGPCALTVEQIPSHSHFVHNEGKHGHRIDPPVAIQKGKERVTTGPHFHPPGPIPPPKDVMIALAYEGVVTGDASGIAIDKSMNDNNDPSRVAAEHSHSLPDVAVDTQYIHFIIRVS